MKETTERAQHCTFGNRIVATRPLCGNRSLISVPVCWNQKVHLSMAFLS